MAGYITISIQGTKEQADAFKAKIQDHAMKQGWSMSELVVEAVAEYLRTHAPAE